MSADLPSIRFPLSVVALPPLPESTVEPMPPGDDPRLDNAFIGVSPSDWYMYSVLQNSDSYPNGFFSWESSDVHMGDIIVPSSAPPVNYPEAKEEDHARGWIMVCFTCPSTPDHGEPDRNRTTGYPFCDERMLSVAPLVSYATLEEPDLEVPISNISDAESIMACTVEINLNAAVTTAPTRLTGLYALSSQFFIAKRTLRGPESEYPRRRYRYNETFPNGVPDDQVKIPGDSTDVEESFSFPTPTSTRELHWWETASATNYGHPGVTSSSSLFKDDADDSGPKTGVIIGTVVPVFVLIVLATFLCKWKTRRDPLTKASPAPIPRNLDPAADARRLAGLPERRYISRRDFIRAEEAAARSIGNRTEFLDERGIHNRPEITIQNDPEELPPAYHKVVTNQERMEIEQRMHAEGTAPQGWPPSYRDAQNADSTPISRPAPATSVPTQSRDLYPALPSSPTR